MHNTDKCTKRRTGWNTHRIR